MSKGRKIARNCKRILIVIFFVLAIVVAFIPLSNQSVTVCVDTENEDVSASFSVEILETASQLHIPASSITDDGFREIRIYRLFHTLCVDKITRGNYSNYVSTDDTGYILNADACDQLRELSHSAMTERLVCIEWMLALTLLLWIIINAVQEKLDPNDYGNHGPVNEIKRFCGDIKKYWKYMNYAAKADLKAEVANSYLNRLWWLLEPFFNMLVYVVVFGRIMGNSIENYATFIFSALLMWNFFSKTINYSVRLVRSNRDIITKVYVPKHVILISHMIMDLYKLLFSLIPKQNLYRPVQTMQLHYKNNLARYFDQVRLYFERNQTLIHNLLFVYNFLPEEHNLPHNLDYNELFFR